MKKFSFLSTVLLIPFITFGQQIKNGNFDSVYIGGIDRIHEWITSDCWPVGLNDTVFPLNPNDHYISTGLQYHETFRTVQIEYSGAFSGPYAIKVLSDSGMVHTDGSPFRGFITNGNHFYTGNDGYIDFKKGGEPFSFRPSALRGHFKFIDTSPSLSISAKVIILLKKYNSLTQQSDTVGFTEGNLMFSPVTSWTPFEFSINYYSGSIPDTLMIAFLTPGIGWSSTLWLDSLGFEYLPAGLSNPSDHPVFTVYPNPASEMIYVKTDQAFINPECSIWITDALGHLVFSAPCDKEVIRIHLKTSTAGLYFIRIQSGDKVFRKKIILQHN